MWPDGSVAYHTLTNGIKAVCVPYAAGVDYFGVSVNAGSRDEHASCHGLAHFVEHTLFKGTQKRRSWHIINRMERVGGELNAFTTKEETAVYSIFPSGNLDRAAELISDLLCSSVFPARELDKERDVVEDEINSYLDTPSEAVFDDFEELIFAGSSLAHNILGDTVSVASLTGDDCRIWLDSMFTPGEMAVFYFGSKSPKSVFRIIERRFGGMDHANVARHRSAPEVLAPADVVSSLSLHQAHTVGGVRIPGIYGGNTHVYALLANIIGGPGMNSLLNVEMRERRGLVYTVEATTVSYSDCGLFTIYFGCDADNLGACRGILDRVMRRLSTDALSARKLDEAKQQYIGQLAVAGENREQVALSSGRSLLCHGKIFSLHDRIKRIENITPDMLAEAAATLSPDNFSFLTFA